MPTLHHLKEQAIANGQRSFVSFLLLQLSNSFLRILAVPNKAVFCNSPVLIVTPNFSLLLLLLLLLLLFSINKPYGPEHEEFHACASILISLTN